MFLNRTKQLAVLAVMAALSTVLTVLGTVISVNTVFFTSAAAFFVGIVAVEMGFRAGTLFFFVCLSLDFLLNPNKLHGFLYMALALYTLLAEVVYAALKRIQNKRRREWLCRGVRLLIFSVCYCPVALLLPRLFVSEKIASLSWYIPASVIIGIVFWLLYDIAYIEVKKMVYRHLSKLRRTHCSMD